MISYFIAQILAGFGLMVMGKSEIGRTHDILFANGLTAIVLAVAWLVAYAL